MRILGDEYKRAEVRDQPFWRQKNGERRLSRDTYFVESLESRTGMSESKR